MADWKDWLEGISGGTRGVVEGLTLGMKPFDAWEKVRAQDLANDKSDVQLEDLYGIQGARNAMPNYYPDLVGAANAGSRRATAQADYDIFGLNRNLEMQRYLSDPEGAFQQGLRETGWQPGDPEYRQWLAEAMGMYSPEVAVGAYDKFGVPAIQNRNLNEQTALTFVENWVRAKDPGAQVLRTANGQVVVLGSDGSETPIPGDILMKLTDMITRQGGAPAALSAGLKDEMAIANTNANLWRAFQTGQISPASAVALIDKERIAANQKYNQIMQARNQVTKSDEYKFADDATKAAMTAQYDQALDQARKGIEEANAMRQRVLATGTTRGVVPSVPSNIVQGSGIRPQGNTQVVAPSVLGQRAAGGAALPNPMGPPSSLAPRPAVRRTGPRSSQGLIGGPPYVAPDIYGEEGALNQYIQALIEGTA